MAGLQHAGHGGDDGEPLRVDHPVRGVRVRGDIGEQRPEHAPVGVLSLYTCNIPTVHCCLQHSHCAALSPRGAPQLATPNKLIAAAVKL